MKSRREGFLTEFFALTRDILTSRQVAERLEKVEFALEAQHLRKPQAEANLASGQAAAQLIEALSATPSAVIQIGTLLIIKTTTRDGRSAVVVRTLTPKQLAVLETKPWVGAFPEDVIRFLNEDAASSDEQQ